LFICSLKTIFVFMFVLSPTFYRPADLPSSKIVVRQPVQIGQQQCPSSAGRRQLIPIVWLPFPPHGTSARWAREWATFRHDLIPKAREDSRPPNLGDSASADGFAKNIHLVLISWNYLNIFSLSIFLFYIELILFKIYYYFYLLILFKKNFYLLLIIFIIIKIFIIKINIILKKIFTI
jgi:hypothetical protein